MGRLALVPALFLLAGCAGSGATPTGPDATVPTLQLQGKIVDASASIPLQGVTISAVGGTNAGKSTTTGADGRYTLANLVSGAFTLRVQNSGYEDYLQDITVTANTTIDVRLIPGRSLSSGWSTGTFYTLVDGNRTGARVVSASVSQSGASLSGQFTGADGSTGSFTGTVAGTRFTGTMQVEVVTQSPARRCRGSVPNVTGTATGNGIDLTAPAVSLADCGGAITNVALSLIP